MSDDRHDPALGGKVVDTALDLVLLPTVVGGASISDPEWIREIAQ